MGTSAPTPGVGKRREAADAARQVLVLTVRGEERRIAPANLPFGDRIALRKATGGLSLESFWSGEMTVGVDSIIVLWWLAGRAQGDTTSTLEDVAESFAGLSVDDLSMVAEDDTDEADPEA